MLSRLGMLTLQLVPVAVYMFHWYVPLCSPVLRLLGPDAHGCRCTRISSLILAGSIQ